MGLLSMLRGKSSKASPTVTPAPDAAATPAVARSKSRLLPSFRRSNTAPATQPEAKERSSSRLSRGASRKKVAPAPDAGAAGAGAAVPKVTIVLFGCDNAGKTMLAAALAQKALPAGGPPPSNGFNNIPAKRNGAELTLFDLGGGPGIRGIWKNYYSDAHAAVFVVDAAAPERFAEAAGLLKEVAADRRVAGKPLLVLANKQDAPHACSGAELADALRVHELDGSGECCVVGAGAFGAGPSIASNSELETSLSWLLGKVKAEYATLGPRVEREVREQKEEAEAKKEERKARLAAKRAAREKEEAEAAAAAQAQAQAPAPTAGVDVGLPPPLPAADAAPPAPAPSSG